MGNKHSYYFCFKKAIGFKWDKKQFVIHHINHDHNDNRIENMVLLPKRLHGAYHSLHNYLESSMNNILSKDNYNSVNKSSVFHAIDRFIEIKEDIKVFVNNEQLAIEEHSYDGNFDTLSFCKEKLFRLIIKYTD